MIEEPGLVVRVEQDAVWVATQRKSTCGSCSARLACGQGLLANLAEDKKPHLIKVQGDLMLSEGDSVTLAMPEELLVRSAFLVYLMPLLSMFGAAFAVSAMQVSEVWVIFAAGLGFLAGAYGVGYYSRRYLDPAQMQPVITCTRIAVRPVVEA